VAYAWMPGARRIRAKIDGGSLRGGAPRAVWLTLGTAPGTVSVQSAATRLIADGRPCHIIWDPVTGEIAQILSVLRAGCALGAADRFSQVAGVPGGAPRMPGIGKPPHHGPGALLWGGVARTAPASVIGAATTNANTEGRVCVQIAVLGHPADPFTSGPLNGVAAIMNWLDSWGVARHWPAGQPAPQSARDDEDTFHHSRALWALGGHFGASQVPGCTGQGPCGIDTSLLTGAHILQVHQARASRSPAVLQIPA
jgi:hypothetical protein